MFLCSLGLLPHIKEVSPYEEEKHKYHGIHDVEPIGKIVQEGFRNMYAVGLVLRVNTDGKQSFTIYGMNTGVRPDNWDSVLLDNGWITGDCFWVGLPEHLMYDYPFKCMIAEIFRKEFADQDDDSSGVHVEFN